MSSDRAEKKMQKVAVILGSNIHWSPYYLRYEKQLNALGQPFDLIIWNREGLAEDVKANIIELRLADVSNNRNPFKLWKFVAFCRFVLRTIKKNGYDKLIFLGTHGCAVSFCEPYLKRHYNGRLWIDIRDNQYEWFPPFYWGEKASIDASYETVISSPKYEKFLPPHDYLHIHNIDPNAMEIKAAYKHIPDPDGRIRISFIGNVRYFEQNRLLLKHLGNDSRFCLQYFGSGTEILKHYCEDNNITNVVFGGAFPQSETVHFYEQTDIINNVYGNDTMNLQLALSNKLYYSLLFELPLLVSEGTFMDELTAQYGIGFAFTDDDGFADRLEAWYRSLSENRIGQRYAELLDKVKKEDDHCTDRFADFISS